MTTSRPEGLAVQTHERARRAEELEQERFFVPPVDIYETPSEIVLEADVPGAVAEGIDISIENRELTLTARRSKGQPSAGQPLYQEFDTGHYRRSFTLGNTIDPAKVSAHLSDGVLVLRLPKSEGSKPRRIPITTG